jgi:hypothetical protein
MAQVKLEFPPVAIKQEPKEAHELNADELAYLHMAEIHKGRWIEYEWKDYLFLWGVVFYVSLSHRVIKVRAKRLAIEKGSYIRLLPDIPVPPEVDAEELLHALRHEATKPYPHGSALLPRLIGSA